MKPEKERIDAYVAMAKNSSRDMTSCIKEYLQKNCEKFKEELIERCVSYVTSVAREILGSRDSAKKSSLYGEVSDDVCYKVAMDYFNDEIWKAEDEEEAKKKAEHEKKAAEKKAKELKKSGKSKNKPATISTSVKDADFKAMEKKVEPVKPSVSEEAKNERKYKDDGQLDMFAALGFAV